MLFFQPALKVTEAILHLGTKIFGSSTDMSHWLVRGWRTFRRAIFWLGYCPVCFSVFNIYKYNNNSNNVYFKSLSYTNVLFKLEMNAQQNIFFNACHRLKSQNFYFNFHGWL